MDIQKIIGTVFLIFAIILTVYLFKGYGVKHISISSPGLTKEWNKPVKSKRKSDKLFLIFIILISLILAVMAFNYQPIK